MPNWKKLLSSGSSGSLAHLSVDTSVEATSFTGSLLRLDENGTGLRMTNVGAFDNASGDFRIFANQDIIISTNGDSGTAVTIDQTTKDANFVGAVTASAFKGDGSQLTGIVADGTISGSSQVDITQTSGYTTFSSSIQTYTDDKVASLVDSAPGTLDTLNELAAALNDDPNFSASIATSIGNRVLTSTFNTYSGSAAGSLRTEYTAADTTLSSSAHTQRVAIASSIPTNNNQLTNGAGYITSADGGNADTIDGIQASSLLRSDADDITTGQLIIAKSNQVDQVVLRRTSPTSNQVGLALEVSGVHTRYFGVGTDTQPYWAASANLTGGSMIWTAGNDGAGSGLDADTLDGLQATSFLRSDTSDTATGIITLSNSTASTNKTTGALVVTGGVGISGALNVGGDVVAYASSDERLKENITPIENATDKVKQIGGYTFDWNDKQDVYEGHDIGVVAQEVEKVLPEVVTTRDSGYKAVKYEKLVALLIQSNKELIERVELLEKQLNAK